MTDSSNNLGAPVGEDAVVLMDRSVGCLALELPAPVHDDVKAKWADVRAEWARQETENQRLRTALQAVHLECASAPLLSTRLQRIASITRGALAPRLGRSTGIHMAGCARNHPSTTPCGAPPTGRSPKS